MHFDGRVPRVDVPLRPVVVGQHAGRTEEHTAHMHQLAEGKPGHQGKNEEEVDVKKYADAGGDNGCKSHPTQDDIFYREKIGGIEVSHEQPRNHNSQQQQQGEIVDKQGNVTPPGDDYPPQEQKRQAGKHRGITQIKGRQPDFEKAVQRRNPGNPGGERFDKKAQVTQYDNQQGPVKEEAEKPEPFGAVVNRPPAGYGDGCVPEKGPKQEDLQGHPSDCTPETGGIVQRVFFEPGQGFLLPAGCRDPERNRNCPPLDHPVDKAAGKNKKSGIGDNCHQHGGQGVVAGDKYGQHDHDDNSC